MNRSAVRPTLNEVTGVRSHMRGSGCITNPIVSVLSSLNNSMGTDRQLHSRNGSVASVFATVVAEALLLPAVLMLLRKLLDGIALDGAVARGLVKDADAVGRVPQAVLLCKVPWATSRFPRCLCSRMLVAGRQK